jgi:hypothetical protein
MSHRDRIKACQTFQLGSVASASAICHERWRSLCAAAPLHADPGQVGVQAERELHWRNRVGHDLDDPDRFVWIRGFRDMSVRRQAVARLTTEEARNDSRLPVRDMIAPTFA